MRRVPVRMVGLVLAVIGALAVAVGCALPWLRIGVPRSAYTLARTANELAVFESRTQRLVLYLLLCVPLLGALALLAAGLGYESLVCVLTVVVSLLGIGGSAVTFAATDGSVQPGPVVSMVGGLLVIVGAALWVITKRRTGVVR